MHKRYYTRYFGCEETAGPSIVSHALRETHHSSQSCRLFFSVPDAGSGAILTPGSGIGKKSGIRIRDEQPRSYFRELNHFLGLKYLNSLMRIRDGKKLYPGSKINIPDPQQCFFYLWCGKFTAEVAG